MIDLSLSIKYKHYFCICSRLLALFLVQLLTATSSHLSLSASSMVSSAVSASLVLWTRLPVLVVSALTLLASVGQRVYGQRLNEEALRVGAFGRSQPGCLFYVCLPHLRAVITSPIYWTPSPSLFLVPPNQLIFTCPSISHLSQVATWRRRGKTRRCSKCSTRSSSSLRSAPSGFPSSLGSGTIRGTLDRFASQSSNRQLHFKPTLSLCSDPTKLLVIVPTRRSLSCLSLFVHRSRDAFVCTGSYLAPLI